MSRPRVLVIDDDPLFRSLLTTMLRKDFSVAVASDGAEGYYRALEQPPHLAVVDIRMPGWDGLKTLKAFREHHGLARVPVMMLTADASRQTVMAAVEAGANDYVIKATLTREDFLRKVCRLLQLDPQRMGSAAGAPLDAAEPARAPASESSDADVAGEPRDADLLARAAAPVTEEAMLQSIIDNWE